MLETNLVRQLRRSFDVRSSGLLPFHSPRIQNPDPGSGVDHEILLLEKWPELWTRSLSLARLKRQYLKWASESWSPKIVLVYNLSPVYNKFLQWLHQKPNRPGLVLLLLDSPNLGENLPAAKRL